MRQAIAQLPREESDAFLLRLARGEPLLSVELNRKLQELVGVSQPKQRSRRTVGRFLAAAEQEQEAEQKQQAEEAEAKRVKELEALAQREEQVWQEVDNRIQRTLPKAYDEPFCFFPSSRNWQCTRAARKHFRHARGANLPVKGR